MKRNIFFTLLAIALTAFAEPIRIVTTTTDLASIAKAIAGDLAQVDSIAGGREDPHDLTARPSFITRASKADLWIRIGLELEIGWEPAILRDARNRRIQIGAPGHLDCSEGILPLDVPTGHVSRADGDVHPLGNPHYWLDPLNGRIIAMSIATRLCRLYPEHKADFEANLKAFEERLDKRMFGATLVSKVSGAKLWWLCEKGQLDEFLAQNQLAADEGSWYAAFLPHRAKWIATYHRSWTYLLKRFRLELAGEIEPKPGVPPSARHLAAIGRDFKAKGVRAILQEPFYNTKASMRVAEACGAKVVIRANCTNGADGIDDYISMLDSVLTGLADALEAK